MARSERYDLKPQGLARGPRLLLLDELVLGRLGIGGLNGRL